MLLVHAGEVVEMLGDLKLGGSFQTILMGAKNVDRVVLGTEVVEGVAPVRYRKEELPVGLSELGQLIKPFDQVWDVLDDVVGDEKIELAIDDRRELYI